MIDKEWKELCEWADNSRKITLSGFDGVIYAITIYFDKNTTIEVNKHGGITMHKRFDGFDLSSVIVWERTYEQIKSIIENLL